MSHTATIKGIKITNIAALESAIKELNSSGIRVSLTKDATPRAFYTDQKGMGKADYVINVLDAKYDVGLYKQPDGSYEPRTDFWGGSVAKVLGLESKDPAKKEAAQLGRLLQMYGIHVTTETFRRQGKSVRRQIGKDGQIQLIAAF